jgi:glycosyltransferase involved in cell wall biosynthesis
MKVDLSKTRPDFASPPAGKILIDGVFFQLYNTGIARLWQSLLEEWSQDSFRDNIVVLDRDGTCPKIPGMSYREIPKFDKQNLEADRVLLQTICDQEEADLFISTYYTTTISTPSVFMGYDMIPEVLGQEQDLLQPMWQSKHRAIRQAVGHITISQNTANDLQRCFPEIEATNITAILCGVSEAFKPADDFELMKFRTRYTIFKPYFMLVGARKGYKNAELFLEGLSNLFSRQGFDVICTGGTAPSFSAQARTIVPDVVFHPLFLSDEELRAAYSGAIALVYPSKYEGFGLPVVEAMKCGCPVITCPNASIPEVGGDAVIYIDDQDVNAMSEALLEVQKPLLRQQLIQAGHTQATKFTWANMAEQMKTTLQQYITQLATQQVLVLIDWTQPESELYEQLMSLFQLVVNTESIEQYEFLIDTTGIDLESADMMLSGILMDYLMAQDAEVMIEPNLRLIPPIDSSSLPGLNISAQIVLRDNIIGENFQSLSELLQRIPCFPQF